MSQRLYIKQLAAELRGPDGRPRSSGYIFAMKKAGFKMTDNRATVEEANAWLSLHPDFTWRGVYVLDRLGQKRK